jgi:oligosaccharide repeat unit polymerase
MFVAVLSLAGLALNVLSSKRGLWSAASVFLFVFWCFHFGIVMVNTLDVDIAQYSEATHLWYWIDSPGYVKAEALALVGLQAYVFGTVVGSNKPAGEYSPRLFTEEVRIFQPQILALGLLGVGVVGWLAVLLSSGGLSMLFSTYGTYLERTSSSPGLGYFYVLIGIGLACLSVASRRVLIAGLLLFGLWALAAFLIGLRGEVLFPLVTFLIVYARRRRLRTDFRLLLFTVAMLSMISFVRAYRVGDPISKNSFNPLFGLMEMGGSLQTVVMVDHWLESGIDRLRLGETLWAPVERILSRVLPLEREPGELDMRLMNVAISERNGPYGFSPVAEGYINFGMPGVIAVMLLLSIILNRIDAASVSLRGDVVIACIVCILLSFVRNSFAHIPGQCLLALGIVQAYFLLIKKRVYARPAYLGKIE